MARSSKILPFAIYEDSTTTQSSGEEADNQAMAQRKALVDHALEFDSIVELLEDGFETEHDADDERRFSTLTDGTFSTLPESNLDTDLEYDELDRSRFAAISSRPGFMRPESVRRLQMSTPPPYLTRSPRKSITRSIRSRPSTPRSLRSAVRDSPRVKVLASAEVEPPRDFPLVLLHITLLPVDLCWSTESMHEILPPSTMENLRRLKAKISETVLQRGILIPHPQHEYDILEERLLEALELKTERITKCGHFRNRESASSYLSADSIGRESDSALGSSVEGSVENLCLECDHEIKLSRKAVDRKWSIEVFAANGLMRAATWAAAWSEMERVDVRVTPWISDEHRAQLDVRYEEEAFERELALAQEKTALVRLDTVPDGSLLSRKPSSRELGFSQKQHHRTTRSSLVNAEGLLKADLPNIFNSARDVPASLLLRNYFALLMHRHNDTFRIWTVLGVFLTFLLSLIMNNRNPAANHYHFSH